MNASAPLFDRQAFAVRLSAAAVAREATTRRIAEEAGVSAATVSRAAAADKLDVESWLRLERWIDPDAATTKLAAPRQA